MTDVFVICNQHGHYWGKTKAWVDGSDPRTVVRCKHSDEALNALFELSSKDVELRGTVQCVPLSQRGEPELEVSTVPLPETDTQAGDATTDKPALLGEST
tara:strand:- start:28127 stop:28426 length:300 start_codon:yes stop_codon:yes gene_type:complete